MSNQTLAILQPSLIPNLHDLAIMLASNRIVLQNHVQWSRKGRVHRAMIRTPDGTQYIHVPIRTEDRKKAIHQIRIDHSQKWIPQVFRSLEYNYRNSVYFDFYEPEIRADFELAKENEYLFPFIMTLRNRLFQLLEIEIQGEILFSDELNNYHADPGQLCKNLNMNQYIQEPDSRHYQRQGDGNNRFELPFVHPVYRQHYENFEPGCCLLDLLFQYGPESFQIIDQIQTTD